MYDKIAKTSKCLPITLVAQESGYYEEADETALANQIEGPAIRSLGALRRQEHVDDESRIRLALYMAALMTRVPRRRAKALEIFPEVLQSTVSRYRKRVEQWADSPEADPSLIAQWSTELATVERKFAVDPPPELVSQIRSPWPSLRYLQLLDGMTWRIIGSDAAKFVTSDNPAYFLEAYGIGTPEAEVCCSLAPDVALHMSRQGEPRGLYFVRGRKVIVKEINRRVATGSERFVFSAEAAPWLRSVCDKTKPYLSRIRW